MNNKVAYFYAQMSDVKILTATPTISLLFAAKKRSLYLHQ